jgi:hypothetical protein
MSERDKPLTTSGVVRNSIGIGVVVLIALSLWGIVSGWSFGLTAAVAGITALLGAGFSLMVGLRQRGRDDRAR